MTLQTLTHAQKIHYFPEIIFLAGKTDSTPLPTLQAVVDTVISRLNQEALPNHNALPDTLTPLEILRQDLIRAHRYASSASSPGQIIAKEDGEEPSLEIVREQSLELMNKLDTILRKTDKARWKQYCHATQKPLVVSYGPMKMRFYKPLECGSMYYSMRIDDFASQKYPNGKQVLANKDRGKSIYVVTKSDEDGQRSSVVGATNLPPPGTIKTVNSIVSTFDALLRENSAMQNLQEIPGVVRHHDFFVFFYNNTPSCCLFQEWYQEGDLAQYLESNPSLPYLSQVELIASLCHTVAAIHQKGLIHRDIKPSNIGVLHNEDLETRLFDLESVTPADNPSRIWTAKYAPPEAKVWSMEEQAYIGHELAWPREYSIEERLKYDVWSVGIVAFQVFMGYGKFPEWELMHSALNCAPYQNRCIPQPIRPLLQMDPKQRSSMAEAAAAWDQLLGEARKQRKCL